MVAYIDIEGALLTSSGGRFGREFDDVLSSFRFDQLDGAHHLAHRAPSTFDEISGYEMAFSAVGSAFTSLHSKLLALKPRLAELAALLLGGAQGGAGSAAKAEQLLAALTDDVVTKLLKDEAEAVQVAKKYLSYFQGPIAKWEAHDQRTLRHAVPENRLRLYDMREILHTIADKDSVLEIREKFGIGIIETFGMTETNAPCFTNPYDPKKRKIGSPGTAYGNEAKVIDPATGREQSRGSPGELMVRGDNVMTGYYKDPENTANTLEPDGWLHSGDLGYMDDDGFVFVTGRIKELIIKGGENIAPREIDEALLKHPAVLEAAAVGIPDANYGQEIMACVILKPGMECSVETLTAFSRQELGPYKTPKVFKFVSELPKGPSGKVQRLKLLES